MADVIKTAAKALEIGTRLKTLVLAGHVANLEPGDATRYEVAAFPTVNADLLFAWLNATRGGRAMLLRGGEIPDADYIAEKMGVRLYEGEIFAAFLRGVLS